MRSSPSKAAVPVLKAPAARKPSPAMPVKMSRSRKIVSWTVLKSIMWSVLPTALSALSK